MTGSESEYERARGAEAGMFRREHIGEGGAERIETLLAVLDNQEQLASVQRLRDWALERLDPKPGESAVDVGAGTGTEVRRLADAVGPAGRAVGVEPNAALRSEAERRAAAHGSAATFVDGDAAALPFVDGAVHVLRCERVFQHLDDPQSAANEFARVLAPGGRVVVLDSDWGTVITHPGDRDVLRRYAEVSLSRMANPFAGRQLANQLRAAGLVVDPDIGSSALIMPPQAIVDTGILETNAEAAVAEGALTRQEVDELVAAVRAAAREGTAFFSVTMFAVVASKLS